MATTTLQPTNSPASTTTSVASIAASLRDSAQTAFHKVSNSLPPPSTPSPQASTNYKEAFALFDKRGNGRVALESLGDLCRACGQNPTQAEIGDLEKSVGGDCMCLILGRAKAKKKLIVDIVDYDTFTKVLNRPGGFRDPGEPEEYCRGFQVFDKDMTGYIGVGQLRYSKSD